MIYLVQNFIKNFPRFILVSIIAIILWVYSCTRRGSSLNQTEGAFREGDKKPNIIFIMADDHAAQAISCYGGVLSEVAKTPNLDHIAVEGVMLTNCFCTNSICTPSRATILTGQYSQMNGVYTLDDDFDRAHQPNVARLLQQSGYQTALIGKWHLGTEPNGFDYYNVLPGQGRYIDPLLKEKGKPWQDGFKGGIEHKGYVTDVITNLAMKWIRNRDPEKPFLLMCHFKASHDPWLPPQRYADLYIKEKIPEPGNLQDDYENRSRAAANATLRLGRVGEESFFDNFGLEGKIRLKPNLYPDPEKLKELNEDDLRKLTYQTYLKDYLSVVAAIDENIGRLLDFLAEKGLTKNTIVIYTSDQGMFLGEHGYYDKRFMYEESLRMPFLARYPGEIKPGTVIDDIIINADFAPTLLDYAGVSVPSDMQGRSFRSNLAGKTPVDWRTAMYYRYWMHMAHFRIPAHYGIRTERYKLIFYYGLGLGEVRYREIPANDTRVGAI